MNKIILIIIFALILIITGCNQNNDLTVDKELNQNENHNTNSDLMEDNNESFVALSNEEAKEITLTHLKDLTESLKSFKSEYELPNNEHPETFEIGNDIKDPNKDNELKQDIIKAFELEFEDYFTKENRNALTREYLLDLYNAHAHIDFFSYFDYTNRFEIIDQQEDYFEASFIYIDNIDYSMRAYNGKYTVKYELEDNKWKLHSFELTTADEQALDITSDEFMVAQKDLESIEHIENIKHNDELYYIFHINSSYYLAINQKNGYSDSTILDNYLGQDDEEDDANQDPNKADNDLLEFLADHASNGPYNPKTVEDYIGNWSLDESPEYERKYLYEDVELSVDDDGNIDIFYIFGDEIYGNGYNYIGSFDDDGYGVFQNEDIDDEEPIEVFLTNGGIIFYETFFNKKY